MEVADLITMKKIDRQDCGSKLRNPEMSIWPFCLLDV